MSTINWEEKRKARRREIMNEFSFYVCVPKLGFTKHKVNDVSEIGIGFTMDTFGEFKLEKDEVCDLHFYLNQSLYLALKINVVRFKETDHIQNIGATFLDTDSKSHETFLTVVKLLDQLVESGLNPRP